MLQFNPTASATLTVHGNLTIKGTLEMRPATAGVLHKLIFDTADENASQGTPSPDPVPYTAPLATDKGLWVLGGGVLDVEGTYREPWARATTGLAAGQTTFTVDRSVQGWGHGDVLQIAPTAANDYAFEQVVVDTVSGTTVNLKPLPSTQLTRSHPAVAIPGQAAATPEIINTTRNAQIWGEPPNAEFPNATTQNNNGRGRAHIIINSSQPAPQTIDFALIRYMGPRKYLSSIGGSRYVGGRYGIHFHKSGLNNDGSTVTGTVVLDSGSHAFVAHMSDGITFSKTVAFNDAETPYWWDVQANEENFLNNDDTNHTTYSSTIAANIDSDPSKPSIRLAGYSASCGRNNVLTNSVAIGIQAYTQSSGVLWPEGANLCSNTWTVTNNVAHNNPGGGIFTWQNDTTDPHDQTNTFVAYRNGSPCLEHGAYRNAFQYTNVKCVANGGSSRRVARAGSGCHLYAQSAADERLHDQRGQPRAALGVLGALRDLCGLCGRSRLNGEVTAAHEDAEQREVHVFAQRHDHLSVHDRHALVAQLARFGILGELGSNELTHTRLVELQPTASQRGLVETVRARGRRRVGHHRDLAPHRDRAPEVEPDPAEEQARRPRARAPRA